MTRTLSLALAALLATSGAASAQEKFTFALNWFAVGDHAAVQVENPRAQSDHASEGARSPELVGAGGGAWATPGAEEETPF